MKIYFYSIIIVLFSCLSNIAYAARVLVHLQEPISATELAELGNKAHIVQNLRPLPWLVLEISNTRRGSRTHITGVTRKWDLYQDVQGHFVSGLGATPNDPRYTEQWHLEKIGAPSQWEKTQGEGVIIALLDSGVDPDHPDLAANILFEQGYNFGDGNDKPYDNSWDGHGTAMAGLMVAECYNNIGGCGVAPAAKVIPYKINYQDQNSFSSADLALAIVAAADSDAQIISMSLVLDEYALWVEHALEYARMKGKILVAAAGNGKGDGGVVAFPAYLPWVIGVGAHDKKGQRLRTSNYGNGLSLSAPGVDLLTTLPGTGYAEWYKGTSPAAALVSGAIAMMIAKQPSATVPELTIALLASCEDVDTPGFDSQSGFGHLSLTSPPANLGTKPTIKFAPAPAEILHPGETLQLDLALNNVTGIYADLFLRLNFPGENSQGERFNLFKIWNNQDSIEKIPYNYSLASPYLLGNDIVLSLYGTPMALLSMEDFAITSGVYELLASLTFADGSSVQARKILWVIDNYVMP